MFNLVSHLVFVLSRPGLLNAGDPGYPWLADSWPATSLPVNSSSGGPNDLSNFGRGGRCSERKTRDEMKDDGMQSFLLYQSPRCSSCTYMHARWIHSMRICRVCLDIHLYITSEDSKSINNGGLRCQQAK